MTSSLVNNEYTFRYYKKDKIPNEIVGLFLGKEKKNLNYLKSMSSYVIVTFIGLRDKDYSFIIVKSNYEQYYNNVLKMLNTYLNEAYDKLAAIKEHKKGLKIIKQKQHESKVKKEMAERIQREIAEKQIEALKKECNNNMVSNIDSTDLKESNTACNLKIMNNQFYGLTVDDD